jgi:hypothetical protein
LLLLLFVRCRIHSESHHQVHRPSLTYCHPRRSFERGQRSGYGRLDFVETDGSSGHYEGEWQGGLYHGQGKVVYPTWSYVGEWSQGEMHGYGMRMDAAGTLVDKGRWGKGLYMAGSDDDDLHLHHGETEETISEALELD